MNPLLVVVVPAVASLLLTSGAARRWATPMLIGVGGLTTALSFLETIVPAGDALLLDGFVRIDATAQLFLPVLNGTFFGIATYVWRRVVATPELRADAGRFAWLGLAFLAAVNAVLVLNHLVAMWIALEASALAVAPLIVRAGAPASRTASWRYLLFSSVGLGLVLLGFFCLERGLAASGLEPGFFVDRLLALGPVPANQWMQAGLALVLLGLGTKLGLAPMYTWLPEAYDEAPPAVTALLAAIQFNAALVLLFRVVQIFRPAQPALVSAELITLGLASMLVTTVSIIATRNIKRLIGYASINHAGVIAIGLAVGKGASYGLLLYALSNAFIKAILFLTAGKIKAHYRTKDTREISGLIQDLPYSGVFLMVGTLALLGFPPFGSFLGELLILSALVGAGHLVVFACFGVLLTMTFVATGRTVFPMIWGEPKERRTWPAQSFLGMTPKLFFLVALVVLGLYVPPAVNTLIEQVASTVEGP